MNDPINQAIREALQRDPLKEAEEITGERYSQSPKTDALGLALVHEVADQRRAILSLAGDTYRSMPLDRFLAAAMNDGFKVVFELMFDGDHGETVENEQLCILWHPEGLLLVCDTYTMGGRGPTINRGTVYYNWKPCDDKQGFRWTSTGQYGKDGIFSGYHHSEALRYNMQNLRDHGEFVVPWVGDPRFNLTHWMEDRAVEEEAKDIHENNWRVGLNRRKEMTRKRVKLLPDSIQECIGVQDE